MDPNDQDRPEIPHDETVSVEFELTDEAKSALQKSIDEGKLKIKFTDLVRTGGSLRYASYNWGD